MFLLLLATLIFHNFESTSSSVMRSFSLFTTTLVTLFLSQDVYAFPTALKEMLAKAPRAQLSPRAGAPTGGAPDAEAALLGFNPTTQYVSNTGSHAFVAPGPSDQRGPCPGKFTSPLALDRAECRPSQD